MKQASLFGDDYPEPNTVLRYIIEHPNCSIHDVAADTYLSTTVINLWAIELEEFGSIERTGWCRRGAHDQPSIMWRAING